MPQPGDIDLPAGHRLIHLKQCASTNEEGLMLAQNGETGPVWIMADTQTHGRGRQKRPWLSLKGNLHVSCVITPACDPTGHAQLGFVAGLACYQAAASVLDNVSDLALKWPNDLLLRDKKTAGLLLERPGKGRQIVIGFGVNVADHPDGLDYPTTQLLEFATTGDLFSLLEKLICAFDHWYGVWAHGTRFDDIAEAWTKRAHGLGAEIAVDLGDSQVTGVFSGLDNTGAMILLTPDGAKKTILAGDYLGLVG